MFGDKLAKNPSLVVMSPPLGEPVQDILDSFLETHKNRLKDLLENDPVFSRVKDYFAQLPQFSEKDVDRIIDEMSNVIKHDRQFQDDLKLKCKKKEIKISIGSRQYQACTFYLCKEILHY